MRNRFLNLSTSYHFLFDSFFSALHVGAAGESA
jgi:hypothetical protein